MKIFKFFVQRGLKNTKLHHFKQLPWLAKYMKDNTKESLKAKTHSEKLSNKLMIKNFYEKPMENIRKQYNFDLKENADSPRFLNRQSLKHLMIKL